MKSRRIVIFLIFIVTIIAFAITFGKTYAKYILTRHIETTFSSQTFYFSVKPDDVIFKRTADKSDYEKILTDETTFSIRISNNDGSNYNSYTTDYEITMVENGNGKFVLNDGNTITKEIAGGSKKDDIISLKLKILNMENPSKTFKIKIKTTSPYVKEEELILNVKQEGAIQTIEDLVDLSLASRNIKTDKFTHDEAISERFKMTRNLDFKSANSYENSSRTDYSNVNSDNYTENLMEEMTKNAGFLPIGEHSSNTRFKGVFNGGGYTLDNILINSAYSKTSGSVGLFEDTENATIKDLTLKGKVTTTNYANMGSIIGRTYGNLTIENVENYANVINSTGKNGGTGGIVGTIGDNVGQTTLKNVRNYGNVEWGNQAGGLIAWVQGSTTIDECRNYGDVTLCVDDTQAGERVGGIIGTSSNTSGMLIIVKESSNHGDVIGKHSAGGIIGLENTGTNDYVIVNSYNVGSITGKNVGGMVGYSNNTRGSMIIVNSANIGKITSNDNSHASGIIGYTNQASESITIKNVYNSGVLVGQYLYGIGFFNATNYDNITIESTYRAKEHQESNINSAMGRFDYDDMKQQSFADLMNEFVNENNSYIGSVVGQYKLCKWEIYEAEYPTLLLDDYDNFRR